MILYSNVVRVICGSGGVVTILCVCVQVTLHIIVIK